MLRPTPGDPWGAEQHHWNTGAEENQQLNPGEALYKPNDNETNFDDEIASFLSDGTVSHDLDFPFTCKEVRNGLSKLKLNKKEGIDIISNGG